MCMLFSSRCPFVLRFVLSFREFLYPSTFPLFHLSGPSLWALMTMWGPLCPLWLSGGLATLVFASSWVYTRNNSSKSSLSIIRFFRGISIIPDFQWISDIINTAFFFKLLSVFLLFWDLLKSHSIILYHLAFEVLCYWIHSITKLFCYPACPRVVPGIRVHQWPAPRLFGFLPAVSPVFPTWLLLWCICGVVYPVSFSFKLNECTHLCTYLL